MVIEDDPAAASIIEASLLQMLRATLPQSDNAALTLVCRNDDGDLIGGLSGSTSYGWLLVKVLWVAEKQRGRGVGSRLLAEAERRAQENGCHAAWLDTSNPDAVPFYRARGYVPFGELSNATGGFPPTHRRVFLKKILSGSFDTAVFQANHDRTKTNTRDNNEQR